MRWYAAPVKTHSFICILAYAAVVLGGCREKSTTPAKQAPAIPADAKWHIEHRIFHRVYGANRVYDIIHNYWASGVEVQGGFLRFTEAGSGKARIISGGQITAGEL